MDLDNLICILYDYINYMKQFESVLEVKEQYDMETELIKVVILVLTIKKHHGVSSNDKIEGSIMVDEKADYYQSAKETILEYKTKLNLLLTLIMTMDQDQEQNQISTVIHSSLNDISVLGF